MTTAHAQSPQAKPDKQTQQANKKLKKKTTQSTASRKQTSKKIHAAPGSRLNQNPEVSLWAQDAASRLQLDPGWVQKTMDQAQRLPFVEKLVLPAASPVAKDWGAYSARFIEPVRIQAGLQFWLRHRKTLERAEREYGVPASIIVGIIGVETLYGQNTGNFRVVDALGTLAFHFPLAHPRATERQAFFRSELEQFLQLTSRSGVDPLAIRGSYAGALGLPQFMPSSWTKFAIDFDGDGRIDLFGSPADAIGSVANYFKAFQWRTGMPTHYPVILTPGQTDMDSLMAPDILPTFSVASFVGKGAALEGAALQHEGPLALIELRNGSNAPSYVAGTENFYAITRYNWSSYYAMAVIDLAEAVTREMQSRP
ncbi:lytic murein transglycosylase B [Limnohabitans sp. 2KL-17]|uniref:lytic murein transglycosylase B n=1 Tax=Limnohabitans sp. 2KL-17 TaxID=1100704 RepID=UPI000D387367|nr:lytic murein transglycosylase B [Limnohabitans sp. 2KL-17]